MKILFLILGALFMVIGHPFRYDSIELQPSWWTLIAATLGLLLFVGGSVDQSNPSKRFLRGFFSAIIYFSISLYWIAVALHQFGEIHWAISIFACLLLSGYCASFYGLWALLAGSRPIRNKPPILKIFCWASSFAAIEAIRQWLFTGFGWNELGYSFIGVPFIAKSAAFWGVHGLTFFWVFIVGGILHYSILLQDRVQRKTFFIWVILFCVLGLLAALLPRQTSEKVTQRISVIQPNTDQEMKWNPQLSSAHLQSLVQMTEQVVSDQPHLIVWPETAYPYLVSASQRQLPISTKVPLLIGAVVRDHDYNRNSALLVSEQTILGRFDKIHLVPFGEFVPLKEWIPFGKLVANAGDFIPGSKQQQLLSPPGSHLTLGPLICYEDAFQRESVRLVKRGANLLVNLTNDAWYGETSAQQQHAAMAQMMVFSTGVPMIRATNNGLSALLTPSRREDLPAFSPQAKTFEVEVFDQPVKTFFVWTYPLMEWIWFFIFVIAFLWKESRQTKKIFFRN